MLCPSKAHIMADALDMTNVNGRLGSVKVTNNQLVFVVWWDSASCMQLRFPLKDRLHTLECYLPHHQKQLEEQLKTKNRLFTMLEGDPNNEEAKKNLEKIEEEIRQTEEIVTQIRDELLMFYNEFI